jgi:hypothetical protein
MSLLTFTKGGCRSACDEQHRQVCIRLVRNGQLCSRADGRP